MTDQCHPSPTTDAPGHPAWLIHPLAPHVMGLLSKAEHVDVTAVAYVLAGAHVAPAKGQEAYLIVAADVLECLTCQGLLTRQGSGDPLRPEDGGLTYRLAGRQATRCIRAMLTAGMTPGAVATCMHLSRPYVYQIRRDLRSRGLIPPYRRSTPAPLAHELAGESAGVSEHERSLP